MEPEVHLFALVREKLTKGSLWAIDGRVYAGSGGDEQPCHVCERPIGAQDVDYEVAGPSGSVHVHAACFRAWEAECRRPA